MKDETRRAPSVALRTFDETVERTDVAVKKKKSLPSPLPPRSHPVLHVTSHNSTYGPGQHLGESASDASGPLCEAWSPSVASCMSSLLRHGRVGRHQGQRVGSTHPSVESVFFHLFFVPLLRFPPAGGSHSLSLSLSLSPTKPPKPPPHI